MIDYCIADVVSMEQAVIKFNARFIELV